jgi:potassium-dependent mechanosensitive channel
LLRTRDNTFIVVPNANLISQDVVNWTHEDSKTRIRIPVSVAYGSDLEHVDRVCLEVAKASPKILEYPAPELAFKRFGESSLDFELLVWIASPMVLINNDINRALFIAFREAGIEVPFPQRDVHIRQQ